MLHQYGFIYSSSNLSPFALTQTLHLLKKLSQAARTISCGILAQNSSKTVLKKNPMD
jgi:hypothetical protein